jgi:predicted peroxiredoxin
MAENNQKLVFMITHGPENPELATIPFVMAVTAQASDVDVLVGFQGNGVMLALKGMADHVAASGLCGPCVGSRMIPQEELVPGASIVGAATFIAECAAATNVLVY